MSAADNNTAPAIEPEQAAMLAQLTAEAAGEPPPPGSPEALAAEEAASRPPVDMASDISGLLQMVTAPLKPFLPSLRLLYTEETCDEVGKAVGDVCEKRGWVPAGGVFGEYREEIAAGLVIGPLVIATVKGVQADIENAKNKKDDTSPAFSIGAPGVAPAEAAA